MTINERAVYRTLRASKFILFQLPFLNQDGNPITIKIRADDAYSLVCQGVCACHPFKEDGVLYTIIYPITDPVVGFKYQ